jgi:hypothetical protein
MNDPIDVNIINYWMQALNLENLCEFRSLTKFQEMKIEIGFYSNSDVGLSDVWSLSCWPKIQMSDNPTSAFQKDPRNLRKFGNFQRFTCNSQCWNTAVLPKLFALFVFIPSSHFWIQPAWNPQPPPPTFPSYFERKKLDFIRPYKWCSRGWDKATHLEHKRY